MTTSNAHIYGALTCLLLICAVFCTTNASCLSSQFMCNNGNCVPSSLKCNKVDDCLDNSDEFGCGSCYPYQFQCFSGQCIDATLACNGYYDCTDRSDESNCSYTCTNGAVRLVGTGSNQASGYGRVEMCYSDAWGTICGEGWDSDDASVVCTQLGFSGVTSYYSNAQYGQGTGNILLYGLICFGTESSLLSCVHDGNVVTTSCSHNQDASVTCYKSDSDVDPAFAAAVESICVGILVPVVLVAVCCVGWRCCRGRRASKIPEATPIVKRETEASGHSATRQSSTGHTTSGYSATRQSSTGHTIQDDTPQIIGIHVVVVKVWKTRFPFR